MSAFVLKWVALITMVIDHIGAVFFPQALWIRQIGRISFPIYAFLLSEGFLHTSSRKKYLLRLLGFALLSELPHDLCLYGSLLETGHQNILFELAAGFLLLWCLEKALQEKKYLFLLPVPVLLFLSPLLGFSYGVYGLALIAGFYLLRGHSGGRALWNAGAVCVFHGFANVSVSLWGRTVSLLSLNFLQLYAALASVPILCYNGRRGKYSLKWFFYLIYPLHLLLLAAIACFAG